MNETICVQGRPVSAAEVVQIRDLIGSHPDWSRYRLSRHLSAAWDWRNAVGQVKDMAARPMQLLFRCPRNSCGTLFLVQYGRYHMPTGGICYRAHQSYPKAHQQATVAEGIPDISPRFVKILL